MIDTCCGGIWLDRGEIQALEIFFERYHPQKISIVKTFLGSLTSLLK